MKLLLLFFIVLFVFQVNAQNPLNIEDYTPGYQHSGIFDTVDAIILIDNKQLKKIQRIEGYAIREWQTWYGGCDPYMDPGYHPAPDEWVETGDYLYHDKKKIKAKIWETEILVDAFTPKPKLKIKSTAPIPLISDTSNISNNIVDTGFIKNKISYIGIGGGGSILTISNGGTFITWANTEKIDTEKVIFYIDVEDAFTDKIKLKKYLGYKVSKYSVINEITNETITFYDMNMFEMSGVISFKKYNW